MVFCENATFFFEWQCLLWAFDQYLYGLYLVIQTRLLSRSNMPLRIQVSEFLVFLRYSRDYNGYIIDSLWSGEHCGGGKREEKVNLEDEEAEAWITQFEESVKPGRLFHSRDWVIDLKQIKREREERKSPPVI